MINDPEPTVVPNLQRTNGEQLSTVIGVALCRCGQSMRKPFCDGTHGKSGFSNKNATPSIKDKRKSYEGKAITIHDNRAVCAHAKECIKKLSVFNPDARPWINPDGGTVDSIIEVIRKCPSGALSYSIGGIEYKDQTREPLVTVSKDGPYVVTGGIELLGDEVKFGEGVSTEHYTLCRCGASNNKPFCDGSHIEIKFRDG